MYNNNYSGYMLGYSNRNNGYNSGRAYGQGVFNQGNGPRRYNPSAFARKKHSGCTVLKDTVAKTGAKKALIVRGWKYTHKFGFVSFVAVPAASKFQKGKNHTTCVARVTSPMGVSTVWCYWNPAKQILSIPDLRMVASGQQNYVSFLMPKNFKR